MDDRPGSPEIDVVGDGDKSQSFSHRSERFYHELTSSNRNSTSLRSANENGAKRLAANTNKGGKKSETVNLRVRNMGVITVKKEPESDEDDGGSYSLSSLLEECDFEKTSRRDKAPLRSPTSFATPRLKSIESIAKPAGLTQGRPRQRLENVISSLKSARAVSDSRPKPTNSTSNFPVPPQRISAAPTPPNILNSPGIAPMGGIGPQIVDVRSLASVVRPSTSHASVPVQQTVGRPLNAGHQRRCATNSSATTPNTPGTQGQVSTATPAVVSGTKPVNIRFVLPANVPFNTDQFQQVLQATLSSLSIQSKAIEPDQLQKAIQAALTSVTKSTVTFNPDHLQKAIENSLAAVTGSAPHSQAAQSTLSPTAVYLPRDAQRQPQIIAPKPPNVIPFQPTVMRVDTVYAQRDKLPSANAVSVPTENQRTSSPSVVTPVTPRTEAVTKATTGSPVVNGSSNNQAISPAVSSTHLNSARDALVKALQKNRVLNNPASLTSTMVSSPVTTQDSFELDTFLSSPPSSPVQPTVEVPTSSSDVDAGSTSRTLATSASSAGSVPPTTSISAMSSAGTMPPTISISAISSAGSVPQTTSTSVASSTGTVSPTTSIATVSSAGSVPQTTSISVTSSTGTVSPTTSISATSSAGSVPQTTSVSVTSSTGTVSPTTSISAISSAGSVPQTTSVSVTSSTGSLPPATSISAVSPAGPMPQTTSISSVRGVQLTTQKSTFSTQLNPVAVATAPSLRNVTQGLNPMVVSSVPPVPVSNINFQISVPVNLPSAVPVAASKSDSNKPKTQGSKAPPTGCGCCSNCKNKPESDEKYMCYFKGCGSVYTKESALRKHHYFYPNHKPRIPLEKATHSVEYFLPADLGESHRNARLRELFRHLTNEEIKELIMPRMTKTVSLFELLQLKSMRAQTSRGQSNISAFKMFSEFERFRKEVENKLLELILLPQGRGISKVVKGAMPSDAFISEQKPESSTSQPNAVSSSKSDSSATASKTVETIVIDSEADRTAATTVTSSSADKPSSNQGEIPNAATPSAGEEVKKTGDTSSAEKKGDSSVTSKQSSPSEVGSKVTDSTKSTDNKTSADQPSESDKSVNTTESSASETAAKDSTSVPMETDELLRKDASGTGKEQSGDVIIVDSHEKTEPLSREGGLELSGEEKMKDSKDHAVEKMDVDISSENKSVATIKDTDKPAPDSSGEKVQDVGEQKSDSQTGIESCKTGDNNAEKTGDDKTRASDNEQTTQVSMATDKDGKGKDDDSGVVEQGTTSNEKKSLEGRADQINEVEKSSEKTSETTTQSKAQKESKEPSATSESVKVTPSVQEPSSSKVPVSAASTITDGSASTQKITQKEATPLKDKAIKYIACITIEDEEDLDENDLLEFGLPFVVKWGKVIKKVRTFEGRKLARKENYTEQDMKQFIYGKPKEAANAVISSDCHAHPSFFRAYVMPALLDKHIDDFGLFGKKLISRLYLSRKKYVDILRSGIGPEFAKILGINIFPTFKRIQDTWQSIKTMTPADKTKRSLVLKPMPEDDVEIPDDEDEGGSSQVGNTVQNTAGRVGNTLQNVTGVQNAAGRGVSNIVPSSASRGSDVSKRPSPSASVLSDNSKKQRLDNADAQKGTSQADKEQTESSDKDAIQSSDASKGQKADNTNNSGKNATDDKSSPDKNNKNQTSQPGPVEKQTETASASDKSTASVSKAGSSSSASVSGKESAVGNSKDSTTPMSVDKEQTSATKAGTTVSSIVQSKPGIPPEHSKPSTSKDSPSKSTSAASIIPKKATIYTSGTGKVGASSLPFASAKGSPLYLVPLEKLPPKLIEQFINQGKGDGIKTRSASSGKKTKQTKPSSQVLVLVPSSNPNGSPTIQTLTSEEQLKGDGDKKPLLLLPADKVPKSMASQSPAVRRKMVITMVSASSASRSTVTGSAAQTTTTTSTSGGQKSDSSATQAVQGPIMSTKEGSSDSNKPPATVFESSTADSVATSEDAMADDPKPAKETSDTSVTSLVSVDNNTSAVNNSPTEDGKAEGAKTDSSSGPIDVDQPESSVSKESDSNASKTASETGECASAESSEQSSTSVVDSNEAVDSNEKSQVSTTSINAGSADSQDNGGLDILGSSVLPSDVTLDNLLKDITGDGPGSEVDEMPPLDVSEIISSFEDIPVSTESSATTSQGAACDSDSEMRSSSQGSAFEDDRNPHSRRQSPRRAALSSKATPVSSLADVSSPNTSGGSRENSDAEDGSPPCKRRKTPTRTSARSSPQVTFVPDKEVAGKGPFGSPSRTKGRKY